MKSWGAKFEFRAIATIQTPFKDKFGIPRQPGLVEQAQGVIKFYSDPDLKTALKTLEQFSHLWIVFVFHEHGGKSWKPSIRPPRLGGAQKVGVLASRSPHRPNPIGMSAVRIESIDLDSKGGAEIRVSGVDLLDGTPILDVKPYIPYADSIPSANAGWASGEIPRYPVTFSDAALIDLERMRETLGDVEDWRALIVQILELDPRPAFKKRQAPVEDSTVWGSRYGFEVKGWDVKYVIKEGGFCVQQILPLDVSSN